MQSKYWEELEARLYRAANFAGCSPDRAGKLVDKQLSNLYNRYEAIAQWWVARGYTRVPDPNNQDFPDWFISPREDMNNIIITSNGEGDYMAVTSGPLPDHIRVKQ